MRKLFERVLNIGSAMVTSHMAKINSKSDLGISLDINVEQIVDKGSSKVTRVNVSNTLTVDVDRISDFIARRIEATKKVSRVSSDICYEETGDDKKRKLVASPIVKKCVTFYLHILQADWHAQRVDDVRLNDLTIPSSFRGLFIPRGVVLNVTEKDQCNDLLMDFNIVNECEGFEESDWFNFWNAFCNSRKLTFSGDEKLDDVMSVVSLTPDLRVGGPLGVERDRLSTTMPIPLTVDLKDEDCVELVSYNEAIRDAILMIFS